MDNNKPETEIPVDFPEQSETEKKEDEVIQNAVSSEMHSGRPRTIEELKDFCRSRGMPLEKMRFFIGEDYQEPKAFGIYQDGDEFIVYKNKANGSRAIRYQGIDEEYAVNELYEKLLVECHNRGIYPEEDDGENSEIYSRSFSGTGNRGSSRRGDSKQNNYTGWAVGIFSICSMFYRWVFFIISWLYHLIILVFGRLINPIVAVAAGVACFLAAKLIPQDKFSKKMRIALLIGIPLIVIIGGQFIRSIGNGYYVDGDTKYYKDKESWYEYIGSAWTKMTARPELSSDKQYYASSADAPVYIPDISNSYGVWDRYTAGLTFPQLSSDPGFIDDLFDDDSYSSRDSSSSDWDSWDSSDTDWDSDW